MPRPVKCRKVCHYPQTLTFTPDKAKGDASAVIIAVDEYETIRLIDKEGMSQEQCATFMQIARTTVQRIYENARKKLAEALVEGLSIRIEGGDFSICNGLSKDCLLTECYNKRLYGEYRINKGANIMRIAVTYSNGDIFQHFGHTEQFKIYDVENNSVVATHIVDTNGNGHGALAGILNALNADALICGGIGGGARRAISSSGIRLYGGVSGNADMAVEDLIKGRLNFNPDVQCNHHDHHHGKDHDCKSHGDKEHECKDGHCSEHNQ